MPRVVERGVDDRVPRGIVELVLRCFIELDCDADVCFELDGSELDCGWIEIGWLLRFESGELELSGLERCELERGEADRELDFRD